MKRQKRQMTQRILKGLFVGTLLISASACEYADYQVAPYENTADEAPATAIEGKSDELLKKISELEGAIDELKRANDETTVAVMPIPADSIEPTPVVEAKKEIVAEKPAEPEEPKKVEVVKEIRAEAPPPKETPSVADAVAYSPFSTKDDPSLCGNGRLDSGEQCDDGDGNKVGWDGCTFCNVDAGWQCDQGSPSVCHPTDAEVGS
jgi:cysteine-rich repeat protein